MSRAKPKNIVNIDALRRGRRRRVRMRQILLLTGVVLVLLFVVYLSDFLMSYDLGTRISDLRGSRGGPGYPVRAPGGIVRDVKPMGSNLAVLGDTNLIIYNNKGRQINNLQQMTMNTAALASRDRILTYDFGGRRVQLHSASKELYTHDLNDMVLGAALGAGGDYAIITSPRNYIAAVSAYNSRFSPMMRWYSSDQYVLGAAMAPRGDMMVIACVDGEGGILKSELYFLRFDTERETAHVSLEGELVVWLDYIANDRLAVLTDSTYRIYDANGRTQGEYLLPHDMPLMAFTISGERMLLLCGMLEARERELILLDSWANHTASATVPGRFMDMTVAAHEIWVVTDGDALCYNLSLEHIRTFDAASVQRVEFVGNNIYYFTSDEINILEH